MDIRTYFVSNNSTSEVEISSGESEVAFITNDRLKEFIKEIQAIYKAKLDETRILSEEQNFEPILELQYHIRQHLVANQYRIDFVDKKFVLRDGFPLSMPSLFGLYMMVVSNIDKIDTIKDVMNQFLKRYLVHMGKRFTLGLDISGAIFKATEINENKLCCCSHKCRLDNMYVIKNSFTDYHVVIGCECIKKNKLIDKDVIIEAQKHTYKAMEKEMKKKEIKLKKIEEERVTAEKLRTMNKIIEDEITEKKRITDEIIANFRAFCEEENNKVFVLEDDANDGNMMRILGDGDDSDDSSDDGSVDENVIDKSISNKVIEGSVFTPIKLHASILGAQVLVSLPVVDKPAQAKSAPPARVVQGPIKRPLKPSRASSITKHKISTTVMPRNSVLMTSRTGRTIADIMFGSPLPREVLFSLVSPHVSDNVHDTALIAERYQSVNPSELDNVNLILGRKSISVNDLHISKFGIGMYDTHFKTLAPNTWLVDEVSVVKSIYHVKLSLNC